MILLEKAPCIGCKFVDSNGQNLFCKAFPDSVPDEILSGENNHSKPCCGQKNKIVFEPIKPD